MGVGGEKCDCAPPCVCVYVQKVADLKPGIELGFWEGWGELEEGGSGARRSASGGVLLWGGVLLGGPRKKDGVAHNTTSWCL